MIATLPVLSSCFIISLVVADCDRSKSASLRYGTSMGRGGGNFVCLYTRVVPAMPCTSVTGPLGAGGAKHELTLSLQLLDHELAGSCS